MVPFDAQALRLILDLRESEIRKSMCGQRLLAWYDNLKTGLDNVAR